MFVSFAMDINARGMLLNNKNNLTSLLTLAEGR